MFKPKTKTCQNCKADFRIEPEDFEFYKKMDVPEPTFCPECRSQRRLAFRNERNLYKRKCDLCGKNMISRYSPGILSDWQKPFKVYCPKCWYSDKWDLMEHGRDYDFNKSFFEQFKDLIQEAPQLSLVQYNVVNSPWVNYELDSKNCYLNIGGGYSQDSAYNTYLVWGNDSFDNYFILNSSLCYESIFCHNCYKTFFSYNCFDCQDTILSYDCKNCSNIIGCIGLRNKKYHIFNKSYSKEEYFKFLEKHPLSSYESLQFLSKKARQNFLKFPRKYSVITKSVNCTGSYIEQSKNCLDCWEVTGVEDSKHLYIAGIKMRDAYDINSVGERAELIYETVGGGGGYYNVKFNISGSQNRSLDYCFEVENCHDCFGSKGLRHKQYCILNKQYTKESFDKLRIKIIEQMNQMPYKDKQGRVYKYGEFFPSEISPFGYNETVNQEYFPLNKEQSLKTGFNWNDYEKETNYQFSDYQIPDDIKDVKDDILKKILKCEKIGQAYRIIPMELDFYRKMGLPIPRCSPLQRHKDRLGRMEPRKLYHRQCMKEGCSNEFETSYAPDKKEIVYCEDCYNKEVS